MPATSSDDPLFETSPSIPNLQTFQTDLLPLCCVAARSIEEIVVTGYSGQARATEDTLGPKQAQDQMKGINVSEPQLQSTTRIWHIGSDYSEEVQVLRFWCRETTRGANANFQAIAGNSTTIHNYNTSEREDRLTVRGRTVRKVIDGDIIFQRVLSSEVLSVKVKQEEASTSTESQVIKIKKMEQTARIHAYGGEFTATSFEPIDEKDCVKFKEVGATETSVRGGRVRERDDADCA
ncbi:hypothetical protein PQX77_005896 [Marasmius sp. AFHP31]|nr:hypothetical protein PQX77_005896 [Marasmius sp. AFHP31]